MDRMNTPSSAAWPCMRIRSPRIAPPLKGEVGSTATMPTLFPWRRRWAVRRSTSVDLPEPGGPVTPTTSDFPAWGKRAASSAGASGRPFSTTLIARASARTSPRRTPSANSSLNGFNAERAENAEMRRESFLVHPLRASASSTLKACPGLADHPAQLQQLPGDDQPLDLARALADRSQLRVAQ